MTFHINDIVQIKVEVAKGEGTQVGPAGTWTEFPAHNGNMINQLHVSAYASMRMPAMTLSVTDNVRFFEWLNIKKGTGITDGARIRITTFVNEVPIVRYFRIFNWKKATSGDLGFTYEFSCYWDEPRYWMQASVNFPIQEAASSVDVLKEIATVYCKFTWHPDNVSSTNDEQIWIPANLPLSMFARAVAQRGYVNNKSHMIMGIDSVGAMRYFNLTTRKSRPPKATVSTQAIRDNLAVAQMHVAQDAIIHTRAGIYNALGGYAYSLVEQFFTAPDTVKAYSGVLLPGVDFEAKESSRNPSLPEIIAERAIVEFAPVGQKGTSDEGGNVYENYERAYSQNYLYNLLNSTVGDFGFNRPVPLEIGDVFTYRAPIASVGTSGSPGTVLDEEAQGNYTVYGKTIYVAGSTYTEKISACRDGTGEK